MCSSDLTGVTGLGVTTEAIGSAANSAAGAAASSEDSSVALALTFFEILGIKFIEL